MEEDSKDVHQVIKEKFVKMQKGLEKDKSTRIPPKFFFFVEGRHFYNLVESLINYCTDLILTENKQFMLEKEAKGRGLAPPKILPCDLQRLESKSRDLGYHYSLILYTEINQRDPRALQSREEQNFYELLILLLNMIIREYFGREDCPRVEEEIHRLFRTNAFNFKKRKHFEDEKYKQFPALKELNLRDPIESLVPKILARNHAQQKNWRHQYDNEKSELKPCFQKVTPFKALRSNSPMISMLCPSINHRQFDFEKKRKMRSQSGVRRPDDLNRSFIPTILEKEMKKRGVHNDTEDLPIRRINRSFM